MLYQDAKTLHENTNTTKHLFAYFGIPHLSLNHRKELFIFKPKAEELLLTNT